jgi:nucleoside-diphosphate-sugar epimerase
MSDEPLHVVLGAAGGTGSAITRLLTADGRRVRAVARHRLPFGAEVEQIQADVSTADGARAACAGAAVVYHCVQPPYTRWPQEFPPLTRAIVDAATREAAKLVMADNLYAYGPGSRSPLTEDLPQRAGGRKGRLRAQMSDELLALHAHGRLDVAIGRASDLYGPGARNSVAGERVFGRAIAGRAVTLPAKLDKPRSWSYVDDVARGLITLADRAEAGGQIWHLPTAEALTGEAFLRLVFDAAGQRPKMRALPAAAVRAAGLVNPMARELSETLYQFQHPFVLDWTKYERAFGPAKPTPHADAIQRTVAWYRAAPAQIARTSTRDPDHLSGDDPAALDAR